MHLLLHACCGPCSAGSLLCLEEEDLHPVLYWDNPNIHPFLEYKSRLDGLVQFASAENLPLVIAGEYGLRSFVQATASAPNQRCDHCYDVRLRSAAAYASANGFEAFSTTLFVSPYQNHELIAERGRKWAKHYGVDFLVRDFRPRFREGQEKARQMGLYMQKYCGCVYSEEERYERKKQKLKTGFLPNFGQ